MLLDWTPTSPRLYSGFEITPGFLAENLAENGAVEASEEFNQHIASTSTGTLDHNNNGTPLRLPSLIPSRDVINEVEPRDQFIYYPDEVPQGRPDSVLSAPQNATKPPSASAALTRQLAELSISLEEHTSLFPPLSIHRERSDQRTNVPYFSLDQTFHLTQSLIDLYPQFVKVFVSRDSIDLQQPPSNGLNSLEASVGHASNCSPKDSDMTSDIAPIPWPQPNHASILLILSCHHRLIDMWQSIFSHISAMPAHTLGQHCLKFKVGSFVPSTTSSAVPMEIIMVVELATQLLGRIKEMVDRIEEFVPNLARDGTTVENSPKAGNGERSEGKRPAEVDTTVVASKVVLDRAKTMVEEICRVRDVLQEQRRELAKATP